MLSLLSWFLLANPPQPPPPVTFKAQSCRYGKAMREARCTGKVRVRRGEARLRCETLTVSFDAKGKVEHLACKGAVSFQRGDERATSQQADYHRAQAKVILKGKAELKRGLARLAGERVIFLLDKDEVLVEGDAQGRWQEQSP